MLEIVKWLGAPGSLRLLGVILALATILWLWRPRLRRVLVVAVGLVCLVYLVLALPPVARNIADGLPPVANALRSDRRIDRLVIFDGDNRRARARVALQLINERRPPEIWVIGMGWLVEALSEGGVPRAVIHHWAAPTTNAQVQKLEEIVQLSPGLQTAVIVSTLQAPRTEALFRAAQLDVTLVSSPPDQEPPASGLRHYLPTYLALRISRDAIYEHAALWCYRKKGWIQ